jgi:hypothetical protein
MRPERENDTLTLSNVTLEFVELDLQLFIHLNDVVRN